MDRRERRVRVLADVDVVEADDRQVARDIDAELTRGAEGPDRHRIRHHEDAGWAQAVAPRRRAERRHAALDRRRGDDHGVLPELDAVPRRWARR